MVNSNNEFCKGAKNAKKDAAVAQEIPEVNQANIYVAENFPQWQQIVLDTLKNLYNVMFFERRIFKTYLYILNI